MKKFALFSLVAVLAAVLTHLIIGWFGVDDPDVLLIPIGIVFVLFYVRDPGAPTTPKEQRAEHQ